MSSNVLTDDHLDETIKKFKFKAKGEKEEIEIVIPEVNHVFGYEQIEIQETNMVYSYEMRKTGSQTKLTNKCFHFSHFLTAITARLRILLLAILFSACLVS